MFPIALIILGSILIAAGIYFLVRQPKQESLAKVIEAVQADGILTPKEERLVRQVAEEEGKDGDKVIAQIRLALEQSEEDSESELIDVNQKAGLDFEKFVVQKFDKQFFSIRNWAGDKFVEGRYAIANTHPDLLLSLNLGKQSYPLAVECKWRSAPAGDFIRFANDGQLERYKEFARTENIPVFIALGVGGKPGNPDELYILPIEKFAKPVANKYMLRPYRKKIDVNFFYDHAKQSLE